MPRGATRTEYLPAATHAPPRHVEVLLGSQSIVTAVGRSFFNAARNCGSFTGCSPRECAALSHRCAASLALSGAAFTGYVKGDMECWSSAPSQSRARIAVHHVAVSVG